MMPSLVILVTFSFPALIQAGSGDWLNKLPSLKLKVGTEGILVSTGPSREEVYWLIAYSIIGTFVVLLIAVVVTLSIYKYCCKPTILSDPESRCMIPLKSHSATNFGHPRWMLTTDSWAMQGDHILDALNANEPKPEKIVSVHKVKPPPPYRSRN